MSVFLCPTFGAGYQSFLTTGLPNNAGFIYTYLAGTPSTAQATYTTSSGLVQNANPIVLSADGRLANEIWLTGGIAYKLVVTDSLNNVLGTYDNISGINDTASVGVSEWVATNLTPTYVSGTSFTFVGNQTANIQVNRRLKSTNTGGTIYSTVATSSYNAGTGLTTITVTNDSGSLDSGISNVYYGLLSATNPSVPAIYAKSGANSDITSLSALTRTPWSPDVQDFRLTLTTGVPVTTADVTGATTIYCTPYIGKSIALYDGTNWNVRQSAEFSLALGTLTSGKPYDVFCFDNSGIPTLEFLVWTNDTTRATALVYQDGILCKTGALTRRYLGTFYTTSTTQTEDSITKRYLYNYYHRVKRPMKKVDATASWTYTTATFRQANGAAANQLEFLQGVAEDDVYIKVNACASNTGATNFFVAGIGIDSTSVNSGTGLYSSGSGANPVISEYRQIPAVGRHFAAWLEYSQAAGTTTFYGTTAPVVSEIVGEVMA